jgi:hypothetical protein
MPRAAWWWHGGAGGAGCRPSGAWSIPGPLPGAALGSFGASLAPGNRFGAPPGRGLRAAEPRAHGWAWSGPSVARDVCGSAPPGRAQGRECRTPAITPGPSARFSPSEDGPLLPPPPRSPGCPQRRLLHDPKPRSEVPKGPQGLPSFSPRRRARPVGVHDSPDHSLPTRLRRHAWAFRASRVGEGPLRPPALADARSEPFPRGRRDRSV